MNNISLDLETMGQRPDAAITAIGAVEFSLEKKILGREFYVVVDLNSAMRSGGTVDASTILWWLRQSDEARREFEKSGLMLPQALKGFTHFLTGFYNTSFFNDKVCVWGNGAAFDNVILRSAYERLDMTPPWSHKNDRCYRTVRAACPKVEFTPSGVKHNALDDAKNQARYLIEVSR